MHCGVLLRCVVGYWARCCAGDIPGEAKAGKTRRASNGCARPRPYACVSSAADTHWNCLSVAEGPPLTSKVSQPGSDPSKQTRYSSSENCCELWETAEYDAIEGLTCKCRKRRTGAVVEGHESRRFQFPYG